MNLVFIRRELTTQAKDSTLIQTCQAEDGNIEDARHNNNPYDLKLHNIHHNFDRTNELEVMDVPK